jgi:hypothetical protein
MFYPCSKPYKVNKVAQINRWFPIKMFTKESLSDIRRQALRKRVWFSALNAVERGILSISAKVIDSVKSSVLNLHLMSIVSKLRDACKSGFVKHLERFGVNRVEVIRVQAASFGYNWAEGLLSDSRFARYLAFLDWNQPTGWRINRS